LVCTLSRHPGATVLNLIEDMLDAEAGHPHVVIFCQGGRRARPTAISRIDRRIPRGRLDPSAALKIDL